MLGIAIDAFVLIVLLKTISEEDIGFGTAFFVALVASIGATILAIALGAALGLAGIGIAVVVAAALLGVTVSSMFGVEIKRSFLIGGIFILVHIGSIVGFHLAFQS